MMQQESMNKLLAWFRANKGFLHPALEMKHDSTYGYHFVASSPLPAGTKVCDCPATLALSHMTAKSEVSTIVAEKLLVEEQTIFCIMEQQIKGADGFWAPYFEMLPGAEEMTSTDYFDEADLLWLKGTNLYASTVPEERTAVKLKKIHAKEVYDDGIALLKKRGIDVSKYNL
jgi:hypothetical protein